jgi:hypothetical protein
MMCVSALYYVAPTKEVLDLVDHPVAMLVDVFLGEALLVGGSVLLQVHHLHFVRTLPLFHARLVCLSAQGSFVRPYALTHTTHNTRHAHSSGALGS